MSDIQEKFTNKDQATDRAKELSLQYGFCAMIQSRDGGAHGTEIVYYVETNPSIVRAWEVATSFEKGKQVK